MLTSDKITEIFYAIDEFMKVYDKTVQSSSLTSGIAKKRNRKSTLSDSEVMTILILFHLKGFRNLKTFYNEYVRVHMRNEFPETVSYNRFVELQRKVLQPLVVFTQSCCLGDCTGISFIDSTPLKSCHIKREKQHRTMRNYATKAKGTMGWFFGFKLHIVINDKGEIIDFLITQANTDDRQPLKNKRFHEKVFGKIYGDRGYIGKDLFDKLFVDGIHLITKVRKNMKKVAMDFYDKILLRKRSVIESVNDALKNICQIEHTRHRSFENFIGNMIAGLAAYSFLPKKPSIKLKNMLPNNGIS